MAETYTRSGYLWKMGTHDQTWHRRYVVITPALTLEYSLSHDADDTAAPCGVISLRGGISAAAISETATTPTLRSGGGRDRAESVGAAMRRFTIQTPDGRELFFEASSESERQRWVEDLQRAGTIAADTQAATDRRVKVTEDSAGVDTEVRKDVAKAGRALLLRQLSEIRVDGSEEQVLDTFDAGGGDGGGAWQQRLLQPSPQQHRQRRQFSEGNIGLHWSSGGRPTGTAASKVKVGNPPSAEGGVGTRSSAGTSGGSRSSGAVKLLKQRRHVRRMTTVLLEQEPEIFHTMPTLGHAFDICHRGRHASHVSQNARTAGTASFVTPASPSSSPPLRLPHNHHKKWYESESLGGSLGAGKQGSVARLRTSSACLLVAEQQKALWDGPEEGKTWAENLAVKSSKIGSEGRVRSKSRDHHDRIDDDGGSDSDSDSVDDDGAEMMVPSIHSTPIDQVAGHTKLTQLEIDDDAMLETLFMTLASRLVSTGVTPHLLVFHEAIITGGGGAG